MTYDSQTQILHHLQQGGLLTVQRAIRLFHTTELRSIVSRLRKRGYPILDRRVCVTSNDGRRVQFKEYYMQLR